MLPLVEVILPETVDTPPVPVTARPAVPAAVYPVPPVTVMPVATLVAPVVQLLSPSTLRLPAAFVHMGWLAVVAPLSVTWARAWFGPNSRIAKIAAASKRRGTAAH